jgi:hypothetical protein
MFNSDLTANRPAAGIVGRIFIAIDSPYGIFRDTGTAWDQVSSAGGGATIYTGDGTLTGTRTISSGGFELVINPQTTFFSSLTASTSASSFSVLGSNTLTFAAGFSSSNIGNVYSANGAINAQIFSGNATFAQANLASAMVNVNKIDFGSGGHTITMTQSTAPGIRAMTGVQNQIQFTGSHNGTISHAAISQNLGFFRDTGSTRTLTITNAYSHLINPLDDYGAGFTFTNRWGIYQAGASDNNYFAGKLLIGTTTIGNYSLDVVSGLLAGRFAITSNSGNNPVLLVETTNGDSARLQIKNSEGSFSLQTNDNTHNITNSNTAISFQDTIPGVRIANGSGGSGAEGNMLLISGTKNSFNNNSRGIFINTILAAASNNTNLIGLDINPTFSPGAFSNITSIGLRVQIGGAIIGGTALNASAQLQVDSTTQGFLAPRMTNAQRTAISSPAVGLIVYCTDAVEGLYVNKSTGWTFVI